MADENQDRPDGFMAEAVAHASRLGWRLVLPLAAAIGLGLLAADLFTLILRPLALLILAIALAEALRPLVRWLTPRVRYQVAAVTLVFLTLIVLFGLLGWFIVPAVVSQVRELIERLPRLAEQVSGLVATLPLSTGTDTGTLTGGITTRLTDWAVSVPRALFGAVLDAVVVLFLAIYWLLGSDSIRRFALAWFEGERREKADAVLSEMGHAMGGYVRGVALNGLIMGLLAWLGLTIIGLPFPVALGVLTMIGEAIPIIGPIIVGIIVAAVGLMQSPTQALLGVALFTVLTQLEGNLLTPNIMKAETKVPQTLVLFAILAGAALGGVLGVLVAVPVAAAGRVFVLRVILPAKTG